jgi:cytosine/adenosine deaminase-related metal-dependent hydrolase
MRPTLYRAGWVLPVSAPPLRDGAVLVGADGLIAAVGPASSIEPSPEFERVDLPDAVLLPGLINTHAHPELAMFRGALEDLAFRDWILRLVGGKRRALEDADYEAAALWTCMESIRAGITTMAATEASGAAAAAMARTGMRGIAYLEVFGPDPALAEDAIREFRAGLDRLRTSETELVRVGISPHAPYTVSDALYRKSAEIARSESLPMALHVAESVAERRLVGFGDGDFAPGLAARGIGTPPRGASPIAMLEALGVLDVRPLLIHCVDLDERDFTRIAEHGCAVAHCPVANARLGHGVAPLPRLLDAGVSVGLGTDSVASNNRLDLIDEARVASLLQRALHRSHDLLPPARLLQLCTLDGARALGLDDRIGTLEPGKDADLCAVSLARPHARPVHDPVAALFHSASASDVVLTVVRGRLLHRAGDEPDAGLRAAMDRVEAAAERLRSQS